MTGARLKIYHLLGKQSTLTPDRGDKINEISFLTALSQFADVYYNEQLFNPQVPGYGLTSGPIHPPKGKYDLYIVRNNIEIFQACPHPKCWVASPYLPEAFQTADAVLTFTEAWKHGLETFADHPNQAHTYFHDNYPEEIILPKRVINIGQVVSPHFFELPNLEKNFRYRALMGYGSIVAYFGRLEAHTMPHAFMQAWPILKQAVPDLSFVLAGRRTASVQDSMLPLGDALSLSSIPYQDMPHATSACFALLANEQAEASWAGSIKPLEAMVRGIPFLTTRRPVREEQLGVDYPLYYDSPETLKSQIQRLHEDFDFYKAVQSYCLARTADFTVEKRARDLQQKLLSLL